MQRRLVLQVAAGFPLVAVNAGMPLAECLADTGDADRMLDQPALICVVAALCAGHYPPAGCQLVVVDQVRQQGVQPRVGDLDACALRQLDADLYLSFVRLGRELGRERRQNHHRHRD